MCNMEETLIQFKTALLAKEKGFNPKHSLRYHYYTHDGILNGDVTDLIKAQLNNKNNTVDTNIIESLQTIKASTQSLLQKWIREEHEIHIEIGNYAFGYYPMFNNTSPPYKKEWIDRRWNRTNKLELMYTTYEDALEEALINALNLI